MVNCPNCNSHKAAIMGTGSAEDRDGEYVEPIIYKCHNCGNLFK